MKRLYFLFLVSIVFASCTPDAIVQKEIASVAYKSEMDNIDNMDKIVGYWVGRGEYMLFRKDGSFLYTVVGVNTLNNYDGTWSSDSNGKLTATYHKANSDIYIAYNATLTYENDNDLMYPDPYNGYHYLKRIF